MAVSINASGTFTVVTRATGADGEVTTNWTAIKLEGAGGAPSATQSVGSTDLFVEGSDAIETTTNKQRVALIHTPGTSYDFTSGSTGSGTVKIPGGFFWIWGTFLASGTMFTKANGGFQIVLGDGTNRAFWNVAGSDTYLGGFKKWAISVDLATRFSTDDVGTVQIGNITEFGMVTDVGAATTRFANFVVDAYDIGDGLTFTGSTTTDKLFLESFNAQDTNKVGILQNSNGIIFCQGDIEFDGATQTSIGETLVFTDTVLNSSYVYACNFTGTHVLTNSNINKAGGVSYDLNTTGGAVTATGGVFTGFNTMTIPSGQNWSGQVFQSGGTSSIASTLADVSFNECGIITLTGTLDNCTIKEGTGTEFVNTSNNSGTLTDCTFVGDGTATPGNAVNYGTVTGGVSAASPLTINWTSTLNNGLSQATWGGSAFAATTGTITNADAAININVPSGSFVKIACGASATVPTVNKTGAGSIELTANEVTLTISGVVTDSDVVIYASGSTTKLQDDQDISGTTSTYTYTYSPNTFVDIKVYRDGYVPYFVYLFELGNASASLPVAQVVDRNYVP
jgi:hypothetical protein